MNALNQIEQPREQYVLRWKWQGVPLYKALYTTLFR
jgi:hypothetical protein